MNPFFRKISEFVFRFRWIILFFLLVITAVNAVAMISLRIDPSMETLFSKDSPEYKAYEEYRKKYGSDQIISVAMATPDLFTVEKLLLLKSITAEIEKIPSVERILSLANAMDFRHRRLGVELVPALQDFSLQSEDLQKIKNKILSNELFLQNLVSEDGRIAHLIIFLNAAQKDTRQNGVVIQKLREYFSKIDIPDVKFYMAGSPVEQYDFIRLIRKDQMTFVPIITALLIITTYLIYQSFACMLVSMALVFMTLIWSIGSIALFGESLNLMTSLLAPVIMIVSVVNSIHIMNLFFEMRGRYANVRRCIILTMEQLGAPCFLTQLTTVFGFFSLALSPVPAIKSFGIFAGLGSLYSYVLEMTLTPMMLPLLPYKRLGEGKITRHFLNRVVVDFLEKIEYKWQWVVILFTLVGVIVSLFGVHRLEVDSNLIKQMKGNLPLAISTRFIDDHLTGVYNMGFVLKRRDGKPITDYQSLRMIDEFKFFLESQNAITKVNSITTVIKKLNETVENNTHAYQIPSSQRRLDRFFEGFSKSDSQDLKSLISHDFKEVRLEVRIKAVGTREGTEVEDLARYYLEEHFAQIFEFKQTGNIVLLGKIAKHLVAEQMGSFGLAFFSIFILICLIFRSVTMALFASIPNLVPIIMVYGLMGWTGIELSSTTAMISSIVMGMVVDASIHFLYRFRLEFQTRQNYLQALHHTFRGKSPALILSTLILMAGFSSSALANFKPTVYFGLFTSLSLFLATLCTLFILPVCLMIFKPFGRPKLFTSSQKGQIEQYPIHGTQESVTLGSAGDWT